MAHRQGVPYIENHEVEKLNALIQDQVNVYAYKTGCLRDAAVAFTPSIGVSLYSTFDPSTNESTYLTRPMCRVEQIYLEGSPLLVAGDNESRPGESSERAIVQINSGYLKAASGKPAYWFSVPPNAVRFSSPFDQVYTDCYFSGRCYHRNLTTDQQVMDFAPQELEMAMEWCAISLLKPLERELALNLQREIESRMNKASGDIQAASAGHAQRGGHGEAQTVGLY
jgi:hypothetical protein